MGIQIVFFFFKSSERFNTGCDGRKKWKLYSSKIDLQGFFYWFVVNNGEPFKWLMQWGFVSQRQNLEVLFSIFMSDGTFLKVRYTKNIPLYGGF